MKLAVLTPLLPTRSGVAHYASLLLPALSQRAEVRAFDTLDDYQRKDYDAVIYQLGNNPHHELMLAEAMREPGVVVLHDLVLHHLIVEMTLARGDLASYVATLEASHGPAGAAWAHGRAAGMHTEIANFLLPASIDVARRSTAVIVHNRYARERLLSFGVETPIHVVPHPYVPETRAFDRDALRASLGFTPETRAIGFFGFLTSAKRAEVVLEAFRIAREREPRLALLIVGEPAPNIDLRMLQLDGVVTTGYVADDDFAKYYAAADRFVNLRYPTAGETSGTLIRALDAGKPVAVSDYAQFAEFPDDCVTKIPLGTGEVDRLADFFTRDLPDPSQAQRAWLEANATLEKTVDGYMEALGGAVAGVRTAPLAPMAIFPQLEVVEVASVARATTPHPPSAPSPLTRGEGYLTVPLARASPASSLLPTEGSSGEEKVPKADEGRTRDAGADIHITIRNRGAGTIRTRTYGEREYRLIVKLFDGDVAVQDRWLSLPRDLAPGETATLTFPRRHPGSTLRLYHALQDVPMLEPEAWAEVRDVR